jgi:hypothetical protein
MAYSVKKAGVSFKVKIETNSDFTGQAGGFSSYYINDATGIRTDIVGSFTEDGNTPGLYFSPSVTIPTAGDYTLVVNNGAAGMDNHPTPIVVTNATIDDVKVVVDDLATTLATVAADVDGLDGQNLLDIKNTLASIETILINDGTGAVDSVMEFVTQINAALESGATGLSALAGYTDDIENMLNGTEFLANGTTPNPFYDAVNPGVAKESTLAVAFTNLQTDIAVFRTSLETKADNIQAATNAVKVVVDANRAHLENAGYGLLALKNLVDALALNVQTHGTNITALLEDGTNGLAAIKTEIVSRFDSVDADLASIEGKIDNLGSAKGFTAFV